MNSLICTFVLVVLGLLAIADAATYTVYVGEAGLVDETGLAQWYRMSFNPPTLEIQWGDSITFVFPSHELHNVVISNGVLLGDTQPNGKNFTDIAGIVGNQTHFTDYTETFSTGLRNVHQPNVTLQFIPTQGDGEYLFYCSLHPGMVGSVIITPSPALTPAQVETNALDNFNQWIAEITLRTAEIMSSLATSGPQVSHVDLPDGTRNWIVTGGAMPAMPTSFGMQMFARFLPSYLEIQQDDTVTWIIGDMSPHWVFFNAAQTFPPLVANWNATGLEPINPAVAYINDPYVLGITWFSGGMPLNVIPPQVWPNADNLINSGMMFGAGGPPVFPSNISVKFTTIGSWNYSCALHAEIGMFGTINVKEVGAALCTDPSNARTCATISAVVGDPQFAGFLGQSFQVHGIDGAVYNLISDDDIQVNSLFSFIDGESIACPQKPWQYAGLRQKIQCWSHAGSYLSAVGVMDKNGNKLTITAGSSTNGFDSVVFNDSPVNVGTTSEGLISVTLHSTHHLSVVVDEFTLHIDNSDGFVNLASATIDRKRWSQLSSHGLLGQTWHRISTEKQGPLKHIEGNVDDYLISENTLFGQDFVYNRFATTS